MMGLGRVVVGFWSKNIPDPFEVKNAFIYWSGILSSSLPRRRPCREMYVTERFLTTIALTGCTICLQPFIFDSDFRNRYDKDVWLLSTHKQNKLDTYVNLIFSKSMNVFSLSFGFFLNANFPSRNAEHGQDCN